MKTCLENIEDPTSLKRVKLVVLLTKNKCIVETLLTKTGYIQGGKEIVLSPFNLNFI